MLSQGAGPFSLYKTIMAKREQSFLPDYWDELVCRGVKLSPAEVK